MLNIEDRLNCCFKTHLPRPPAVWPHDTPLLCPLLRRLPSPSEGAKELLGGRTGQGLLWTLGGVQRGVSRGVLCCHSHCHAQPGRAITSDIQTSFDEG